MPVSSTPEQFRRAMSRRLRQLESGMNEITIDAATEGLREMAAQTPVDTGLARSNWITTLSAAASYSRAAPFFPYPKGTNPAKFLETQNLEDVVFAGQLVLSSRELGTDIFITNSVDYVVENLDQGSSVQSPGNFLQHGLVKARVILATSRWFE